jgi:hypothetical protein
MRGLLGMTTASDWPGATGAEAASPLTLRMLWAVTPKREAMFSMVSPGRTW